MKITFTIFIFLVLTANSSYACLSASQNRVFPLGSSNKFLLVVETHLFRTEYRDKETNEVHEMKPAWSGVSYFKIYDNNLNETYSEVIDTLELFKQKHYADIVGRAFNKGMTMAKKHSNFTAANPISISFCDYQQSCSKAALSFDTVNNKVMIQIPDQESYQIKPLTDTSSIASNLLNHYKGFNDKDLSAKGLQEELYINSVRQFKIGKKKLIIIHVGSGQTFELAEGGTYPPGKEYNGKFTFNNIEESIFIEPVLHHGHGFDFAVWEKI